jgi:hypothetical protein
MERLREIAQEILPVAKLLGVPIDRFFFINGAGSRPDFRARISAAELAISNGGSIAALSPSGHVIQLEVKARTGWANYHKGEEGLELLYNLSMKASSSPNYATISIVISLPGKDQIREKRTRILVADPGDPSVLDVGDQLVLLLEEALPLDSQILRVRAHSAGGTEYGITWRTCHNVTANLFDDP